MQHSETNSTNTNKKDMVRFAIIGTGRISDWVLKGAIEDPRFKAVAVCSRSLERAREFIDGHPDVFDENAMAFDSVGMMLSCPDIDAVYIGTPNMTHHDYTIDCLDAGKHVLCEKPLALNATEAKQMIEASKKNGKALMEAMISTLNPNFIAARKELDSIRPIRHYSSTFCQYSSKYDALKNGVVASSFNPKMGGGALPDIGVYTTFPAVALFGKPRRISAARLFIDSPEGRVEIQGTVEMIYNDMSATLTYSKAVDSRLTTEVSGEGGIISMDQIHICRKAEMIPHGAPTSGRKDLEGMKVIREGLEHDEYFYEFAEFIDVIERGDIESTINSHEVSLVNMELMDEIKKL